MDTLTLNTSIFNSKINASVENMTYQIFIHILIPLSLHYNLITGFCGAWVTSAGENRRHFYDRMLWAAIFTRRACLLKCQVLSLTVKLLTNLKLDSFFLYMTLSSMLFIYSKPLSNMCLPNVDLLIHLKTNVQHWKFEYMQSAKHALVLNTPTHTPVFSPNLLSSNNFALMFQMHYHHCHHHHYS